MSDAYNPYAAPTVAHAPPPEPFLAGDPRPWTPEGLISEAWECFKRDWVVLIGSLILGEALLVGIGRVIGMATDAVAGPLHLEHFARDTGHPFRAMLAMAEPLAGRFFISLAFQFPFTAAISAGWTTLYLASARGQSPSLGTMFTGMSRFFPFLIKNLLSTLVVGLGMALLIVPGVIATLGLAIAGNYVVDQDMSATESMAASWRATNGFKGRILVLVIYTGLLTIAGLLACGVGILVSLPVIGLAITLLYLRLNGQGDPTVVATPTDLPPRDDYPPFTVG
jgi:hypothetical protein